MTMSPRPSILNPLAQLQGGFAVAASRVTNQPAGCPVLYEVEMRWSKPLVPGDPDQVVNVVFRESENQDFKSDPTRMVFRAPYTAQGQIGQMYWTDLNRWYQFCEVRVRAMNGNGQTSGWGTQVRLAAAQPPRPPLLQRTLARLPRRRCPCTVPPAFFRPQT